MTSILSSTFVFKALRKLAGAMFGIILAAGAFEIALRAMAASPWWRILPAVQAQFDGPDPETGYAHRPNVEGLWLRENRAFVRINGQGLRDRPRSSLPAPGTLRIAVAGDSITEALQVEEVSLFTLRAEKTLSDRGLPVEMLNFGLSGALPLQQLLFVAHRGLPLQIDTAIFIFNAADFLNSLMRNDHILPAYVENAAGELVVGRGYRARRSHRLADQWIGRVFFWSVDHSLLMNSLYTRAKMGFLFAAPSSNGEPAVGADKCDPLRAALSTQEQLWRNGEPSWAARRVEQFLKDVPKLLQGRKAIFILQGFGNPGVTCPAETELRPKIVELARSKIEAAGIGFVDLDQELNGKLDDPSEYRKMFGFGAHVGGGHLNSFGHEIYARVLADVVAAHAVNIRAGADAAR